MDAKFGPQPVRLCGLFLFFLHLVFSTQAVHADVDLTACRKAAELQPSRLTCNLAFAPDTLEREEILRDTLEMVENLRCVVSIDIARSDAERMLAATTWQAPKQSGSCDITSTHGAFTASFSMTPEVTLSSGRVISARLNADDFEGAPPLIAKALKSHINFNSKFQDDLADIINANLKTWLTGQKRAGT
jgi:hypothetical protein